MDDHIFIVYKTINKINGKFYIGVHKTKNINDGYMGSGKYLKRAIKKYGTENFERYILFEFETEQEAFEKESELVTEDLVKLKECYNLKLGGDGGWDYLNYTEEGREKRSKYDGADWLFLVSPFINKEKQDSWSDDKKEYIKRKQQEGSKKGLNKSNQMRRDGLLPPTFTGKTHSDESKQKMSETHKDRLKDPTKNSQYGTMWITDGVLNKKIKKDEEIPEGWYKGRVQNLVRCQSG